MIFDRNTTSYRNFNMKHLLAVIIILSSFTFSNSQILVGQSDVTQSSSNGSEERYQDLPYFARKNIAVENLNMLKEGTLIVRLVSFQEKINLLEKAGKMEQAEELKFESDGINKWFVNEFNNNYNFSDVVFCYGLDLKEYLEGNKKNVFLNDQLEIDQNISVKPGPIYIFASQATDSYYLYDKQYRRIPEPAPHAVNQEWINNRKHRSLDRVLELFRGVKKLDNSVQYFNEKLHKIASL